MSPTSAPFTGRRRKRFEPAKRGESARTRHATRAGGATAGITTVRVSPFGTVSGTAARQRTAASTSGAITLDSGAAARGLQAARGGAGAEDDDEGAHVE